MITSEFSPHVNGRIGKGLIAVALLLALCAVWRWQVEAAFIRSASLAEGRVISVSKKQDSADVEFRDATGQRHSLRPWVKFSFKKYAVGERVSVLFDPGNPESAKFNESMQLWASTYLCLYLSAIAGVLGLLVIKRVLVVGPLRQTRIEIGQP
jgi:hypothetical protein